MGKISKRNWSWVILLGITSCFISTTVNALNVLEPLVTITSGTFDCGTQIEFTTTLQTAISASDGETSVGLYYRLEKKLSPDSYFWTETINAGSNSIKKYLKLPSGDYSLVCYQKRKGGPIKSYEYNFNVPNSSNPGMCPVGLPTDTPSGKIINLSSSWNLFTNPFFSFPSVPYHITNSFSSYDTPTTPWIFLTLSLKKWSSFSTPIEINFDNLAVEYEGAIFRNSLYKNSGWPSNISSISDDNNGKLTINRSSIFPPSLNDEINIFLIFKKKSSYIDGLLTTSFHAEYQNTTSTELETDVVVPIRSGPHDPNGLGVDIKTLCPCQCDEWLTYQVNYQNNDKRPASKVLVELKDFVNLDASSVQVISPSAPNKTLNLNGTIAYNQLAKSFTITSSPTPYYLPGSSQTLPRSYAFWETEDFFKFRIRKSDCLPSGTVIRPHVLITFYDGGAGMTPISTNLERTDIVDNTNENLKPCRKVPCVKCKNCPKKRCWLLNIFKKKEKK